MGEKEALAFLKKSNKSLTDAWDSYVIQNSDSKNKQLNDVFKHMFKAWRLSNQRAIDILENKHKPAKKIPVGREKKSLKK